MSNNAASQASASRRALGVVAFTQVGQMLSSVTSAQQGREALLKAAKILTGDSRFTGLAHAGELAARCGAVASDTAEAELVSACRAMAATLAREATSLSKEIQGGVRRGPPVERPPLAPVPMLEPLAPQMSAPETPASPIPTKTPPPGLDRVTVARTDEERDAVAKALEHGLRFAALAGGGIIDIRLNAEWSSLPNGVSQIEAERIACVGRIGGYSDWRLPTEDELVRVLWEEGQRFPEAVGVEPDAFVWVSSQRWCWWRFRTEGKAINLSSHKGVWRSVRDIKTRAVLFRS